MDLDLLSFVGIGAGLLLCAAATFYLHKGTFERGRNRHAAEHQQRLFDLERASAEAKSALIEAEHKLAEQAAELKLARPFRLRVEYLANAIEEMKTVWLGPANEVNCENVLRRHLWVLEPEFVAKQIAPKANLTNVASCLFPDAASFMPDHNRLGVHDNVFPDIAGLFYASGSMCDGMAGSEDPILLLIETKKLRETSVTMEAFKQVHTYAFSLMQRRGKEHWGKRIECLVVGPEVADGLTDANLRWGPNSGDSIRITPLTYQDLITRAERIYANLIGHSAQVVDLTERRARVAAAF